MFKRIVVPLDGSALAASAVPVAVALAQRTDAAIALVRVVDLSDEIRETVSAADRVRREDARTDLAAAAVRLRDDDHVPATIAIRQGNPVGNIIALAGDVEGDLICMATHGRSGLRRVIIGSVAERVLHDALVPILLVRPGVTLPADTAHTAIMVPLDGSERAELSLPYAINLAQVFGAALELVRVWSVSTPASVVAPYAIDEHQTLFDVMRDATEESVVAYLESVKARLTPDGTEVRITALRGDAAEQLCGYIGTIRPMMVVMGTHGRSGLSRWALGSVAADIVRVGIAPVLLVRPAVASVQRDIARIQASAGLRSSEG
ncbi:MAG TPA: universal stress protein [Thermomicrobiales bacterium]